MDSSKPSSPKTRTLADLYPGDTVRYLGTKWRVTGFLPLYANMIGRELRCLEGKGADIVSVKIHESEEIATQFEIVEDVAA